MMMKPAVVCVVIAATLLAPAISWAEASPSPRQNVDIMTPEAALYVMGVEVVSLPDTPRPFQAIVVGRITVEVAAEGVSDISFYVDDELMATDDEPPYTWLWDTGLQPPPIHTLRAVGGEESDEIGVLYIHPFGS